MLAVKEDSVAKVYFLKYCSGRFKVLNDSGHITCFLNDSHMINMSDILYIPQVDGYAFQ